MFLEDYIDMFIGSKCKQGTSKPLHGVQLLVSSIKPEDLYLADVDHYFQGKFISSGKAVAYFRNYFGHRGFTLDFVAYGDFSRSPFWNYEDLDLPPNVKLKNSIPGSGHVTLLKKTKSTNLKVQEFLDQLISFCKSNRKARLKNV